MTIENLILYTYDETLYFFKQGIISQELWEEFQLIWRNSVFRYSNLSEGFEIVCVKGEK